MSLTDEHGIVTLEEGESISLLAEVEWVIDWLPDEYIGAKVWRFAPTHQMHAGYWLLPIKPTVKPRP